MRDAILAVLILLLSGCFSSPDSDRAPPPDDDEVGEDGRPHAPKPDWEPGMSWSYQTERGTSYTAVVTRDEGEYNLLASDPDAAFSEAYVDELFLGEFDEDFAGTFHGEELDLLAWPLKEGSQWQAAYRGQALRANATFVGSDWIIEYAENEEPVLMVHYSSDVGWVTRVAEVAQGEERTVLELTGSSGFSGSSAYSYGLVSLVDYNVTAEQAAFGSFNVADDATDLFYSVEYECGQEAGGSLVLLPRDEPESSITEILECPGTKSQQEVVPVIPGPWTRQIAMWSEPQSRPLEFRAELLQRTLVEHDVQP